MRARPLIAVTLFLGCSSQPAPSESASSESSDASADSSSSSGPSDSSTSDPGDSGTSETDSTDTGTDTGDATETETGGEGSPGCSSGAGLADGEHTFMLAGLDRRYILRLPETYSADKPWPLIFALHGNGGDPDYWDQLGGDRDIRTAFAQEAILVIPEAINNAWRDYNAPPETWPAGIELELDYFDTIYDTMREELCIDEDNVFSMGFSGGGSFSGVLGCRRDYIRAIAVGGSVIYFEPEQCVSAPAAWITIGDLELTQGREDFRDFFRDLAGCLETATPGMPDGCVDYEGCDPGTPVTFCAHPGDHIWPPIGTMSTKAFFQQFYQG